MVGCPGSGKSSFIKDYINKSEKPENIIKISRDEIRFSFLGDNKEEVSEKEYFSKEKKVYKTFIKEIQKVINNPKYQEIFVDATHLTEKSRFKTLNSIGTDYLNKCKVIPVFIDEALQTCIDRNSKRTGKEKVPTDRLVDMWFSIEHPKNDMFKFDDIWDICHTGRRV